MEAHILALLVGLVGMLAHFWKKKVRKQTLSGLWDYIKVHPAFTAMATAATVGAAWILAPDSIPPLSNYTALIAAFTPAFLAGFGLDSTLNKTIEES